MKILNVFGARPQIIKASALSRAISYRSSVKEVLLHTGQHFDNRLSGQLLQSLGMRTPDYTFNAGSIANNYKQLQYMINCIYEVIENESPDHVVVYGDTRTTLAGAEAASKANAKLSHVEAGLRSFNPLMPEEHNRVVADQLSDYLFAPTIGAFQYLKQNYGRSKKNIVFTGDITLDNIIYFKEKMVNFSPNCPSFSQPYLFLTLHRNYNVDDASVFYALLKAIKALAETLQCQVVWPVHPRANKALTSLTQFSIFSDLPNWHLLEPQDYFETLHYALKAKVILTDSGGLQREAFMLQKPCVVLRTETEWTELIQSGASHLWHLNSDTSLFNTVFKTLQLFDAEKYPSFYGSGNCADIIIQTLTNN